MKNFKESPVTIMLSRMIKGKAPGDWGKPQWAKYHQSFRQKTCTAYEMAINIWRGYSFTPVFSQHRREEFFVEAWHMAFDFDSSGADLDFLMRPGTFADYFASFAYATPSSTEDHPKSRVVFIFELPLLTAVNARKVYMAIAHRFLLDGSYCDPQCKDPLRLYYGSPDCRVVGNWSILVPKVLDYILDEYDKSVPPVVERKPVPSPVPVADDYIQYHISKVLDALRQAAMGERHLKRRNISRAMGGFVAAGYMESSQALSLLIDAALQATDNRKLAEEEVKEGFDYGLSAPLYIEYQAASSLTEMLL